MAVVGTWGVFYEKAQIVKAALAADLCPYRRSVPESSIRTLREPVLGLGGRRGSHHCGADDLYVGLEGS